MKSVLIIHHLEPEWEDAYRRFDTSFDELQEKFIQYLNGHNYDKVILTRFDDHRATIEDGYFPCLLDEIDKVENYGYGWERTEVDAQINGGRERSENWADGGSHSEVVWLADFLKELKGNKLNISGAFDGECLEDLEVALSALSIKYKRIESLII